MFHVKRKWNLFPGTVEEAPTPVAVKSRVDRLLTVLTDIPLPEPGQIHIALRTPLSQFL